MTRLVEEGGNGDELDQQALAPAYQPEPAPPVVAAPADHLLDPEPAFDEPYPEELSRGDLGGRSEPRLLPALENQSGAWAPPSRFEEGGWAVARRQEPSLSPAAPDLSAETGLRISPDQHPAAPPPVLPARHPRSHRVSEFMAGAVTGLIAVAIYLLVTHPSNFLGHATPQVATSPSAAPAPRSVVATAPAREAPAAPGPMANASPGNGAPPAPAAPAAPGDAALAEMLPPSQGVGQLLSLEEVRYCVFQGRRLAFLRNEVVSEDSVRRFNTLLADFNSRCKSFRYEGDALQSANKQADARQDQLKADADSIVSSWTGQSVPALIDLQARQGAVQVQARLKALGYYQGKVDGAWGPRSAAALSNFRQSTGLGLGALWDLATQSALLGK